jgi:meso-butanediol dehydrogenase / (S,S)-butanediol dehydrogenase / diacetyl reductase
MNRFIGPAEVADVVLFLCSDSSKVMTGQALNVTAGMLMT